MKSKKLGQVFTPLYVVELMLGLYRQNLRHKKILEAGCGAGSFLTQIVSRYIDEFLTNSTDIDKLKAELEANIIGIDIDSEVLAKCKAELDLIAQAYGLQEVKWNLINGDFLELYKDYKGQIDYIVGNPPYIRVHNLDTKARAFSQGGMTDLYLIFFELGFECLKDNGVLTFITPSSWLNSNAGSKLRIQIKEQRHLDILIDFTHKQIFEGITTYSLISSFTKGKKHDFVKASKYQQDTKEIMYEDLFVKDIIFLGEPKHKKILEQKPLPVKNGYATLCDEFFVGDFLDSIPYPKIAVYKASNGKWYDCIYPYNVMGEFDEPSGKVLARYKEYETKLKSRDLRGADWRGFGRTQGIADTYKRKVAFNTLVRDIKDLRICEVQEGCGVYAGLYIVSDLPVSEFERVLKTSEFLDYVRSLRKYKNGGYYTFSGSDLGKFLAYNFSH